MSKNIHAKKLKRKQRNHYKVRQNNKDSKIRLSVFKSSKHIYAQLIDDSKGVTLASSSSVDKSLAEKSKVYSRNKDIAKIVGIDIAAKAKDQKITNVVFDRGGCSYHGVIKSLADAARENNVLKF